MDHCCVQGWTGTLGDIGNFGADPRFVPGPVGCYYLSHISAGQAVNSLCINTGSDMAANLGFDTLTTRSDEVTDTGIVDIGYHYYVTGQALIMGDYDRDGHLTLPDFAEFQRCFTGRHPMSVSPCCRIFEFGPDTDVDLDDFADFEAALTDP